MKDVAINESLLNPCFAIAPSLNLTEVDANSCLSECPESEAGHEKIVAASDGHLDALDAIQMARESLLKIEGVISQIEQ